MMRTITSIICFMAFALAMVPVQAQQNAQIKNLLLRFKNWRYGMISLYKVPDADEAESMRRLNILLGPREPEITDDAKECKSRDDVESIVLTGGEGMEEKEIQNTLRKPGCKAYERYYTQKVAWEKAQFKKAYVLTTRRNQNEPFEIIGLLTQRNSESYYALKDDLDPPTDIYMPAQLQNVDLEKQFLMDGQALKGKDILGGTAAATLLDYLNNQLIQSNYENVTPEAQGIGEEGIRFVQKKYGNTLGIPEDNVQTYMRISEGLPQDYQNNNEVIVSVADGVSYRRYERKHVGDAASEEVDSTQPTNANLPLYGVELRYGLEDINYPSLWSNRTAVNALWGSSKLGLILPTAGWSELAKTFGNTQTMTYAGLGINGSFDFPIKVIDNSGVFNVALSYVFDDATQSDHMRLSSTMNRWEDYLVRYHATMQYSFAVSIDKDYLFRLRLGATIYGMETWTPFNQGTDSADFRNVSNTTVGGVSGRVEFMTTSWSTPAGFSLGYFDETVLGTAWLQIPVADSFSLRIDTRVFAPVFRDPRPWETSAVVMPAIRFIFNF